MSTSRRATLSFNDGTIEKVSFTDSKIEEGVVRFWYTSGYGLISNRVSYPLVNIRKWEVED